MTVAPDMIARRVRAPDGSSIAYGRREAQGSRRGRVLLVHALAQDRSNWDEVIAALSTDLDVVAVDCRGHGASEAGDGTFTVERFADDLSAILDAEGWPDAVVAGCSMGGCVALAFAARHPGRTAGLLLVDTTAWYGPDAAAAWQARAEKAQTEGLESLVAFQTGRWFGEAFRAQDAPRVARAVSVFLGNDVDAYVRSCAMLGAADLREAARGVTAPTRIVVGEADEATPFAMAAALRDAMPGSRLTVLPGAKHFTPIERPGEVAAELTELCAATVSE